MFKSINYKIYSKFLNILANKLTKYYYSKLNKPFKISNKLKGKGYDPVTSADKAFEKFIIKKKVKVKHVKLKTLNKNLVEKIFINFGGPGRTRTSDQRIMSPLL